MGSFNKFKVQKQEEAGLWFDIPLPSGRTSGEKMLIAGKYAKVTQDALASYYKKLRSAKAGEEPKVSDEVLTKVILGWTCDDECTSKNISELFAEAEYLVDWVWGFITNHDSFFANGSPLSPKTEATQSDSSSSGNETKTE